MGEITRLEASVYDAFNLFLYAIFFKASRCLLQTDCIGKSALSPELKAGILDSPGAQMLQTAIIKTIHVVLSPIQGF